MQFADSSVPVRIPESLKKAGLSYVATREGLELPVIDLCHPAFALDPSDEELARALDSTMDYVRRASRMPPLVRRLAMGFALRGSRLAAYVGGARGGFLSGIGTYLLKIGPDNLGPWAGKADRAVAASFPCYSARLRMRDAATLLAEEISRMAEAAVSERLRLVGIAGGTAMDIVNALILARRRSPRALEDRAIRISVLDTDVEGPAFGKLALAALGEEGGPLRGLDASMAAAAYDWDDARAMAGALGPAGAAIAFSSEGGLFEYASDGAVSANLLAAGEYAGPGAAMVGTMSVAEGKARLVNEASGAALRLRSPADLLSIVEGAGWAIERIIERPLSRSFLLRRR